MKKRKSAEEKEKRKSKTWELVEQFCKKEGFDLVKPGTSNIDKNNKEKRKCKQTDEYYAEAPQPTQS